MMTLGFEHGSVTEWSMRALAVLLDASVKGLVVIAAAGLAAWLMRRRSASVRHLVWSVAVAGLVVLPGLSVMLPSWQVAILPEPSAAAPVVTVDGAAALTAAEDNTELPVTEWGPDLPAAAVPSADSVEAGPDEMLAVGPPADAVSHWPVWLVAAWLMGAAAVLGHFGLGLVGLWRLTRRSVEVADGPLAEAFDELRRPFGLARLRLLRGRDGRHEMPMAWGLVRPFVFIPADSRHWSAERARVVLVHELAHIRRLDCLTQLAARLACAIYWFNPLAWLAGRWLRAEGEQACDDMVVSAGHRASDYAEHLLYIARSYRAGRRVAAATVPMARTSRIEGRLRAILDPARRRGRLTKAAVVAALRLFQLVQIGFELLLVAPGRAVDALQHWVVLIPAPVCARDRHQLESVRRDLAGVIDVRPAAEILEAPMLVSAHGYRSLDLVAVLVKASPGQAIDQLQLIGLIGKKAARILSRYLPAFEGALGSDRLPHALLDLNQVLGSEGARLALLVLPQIEIIVKARVNRRADRYLGMRIQLQDRLCHHVRSRVAQLAQHLVVV